MDSKLYSSAAQDFSKDRSTNLVNITFSSNPPDTGNLLSVLNVKVGAYVMLTTNIDVCDGLTNGVMSTVSGIITKRGKVHVILAKCDSDGVGTSAKEKSIHKSLFPGAVSMGRIEATFSVKNRGHVWVSRTQFPLFRWFKFTLKPPYAIMHWHLLSAIRGTSHWTSFVKLGLKTTWDIFYDIFWLILKYVNFWLLQGCLSTFGNILFL